MSLFLFSCTFASDSDEIEIDADFLLLTAQPRAILIQPPDVNKNELEKQSEFSIALQNLYTVARSWLGSQSEKNHPGLTYQESIRFKDIDAVLRIVSQYKMHPSISVPHEPVKDEAKK